MVTRKAKRDHFWEILSGRVLILKSLPEHLVLWGQNFWSGSRDWRAWLLLPIYLGRQFLGFKKPPDLWQTPDLSRSKNVGWATDWLRQEFWDRICQRHQGAMLSYPHGSARTEAYSLQAARWQGDHHWEGGSRLHHTRTLLVWSCHRDNCRESTWLPKESCAKYCSRWRVHMLLEFRS